MGKEKLRKYATVGIIALAVVMGPVVYLIVKSLFLLAVAGTLALTIVNTAPWLSMKLANLKVWAIKHEAASNPIETLTNVLLDRREKFRVATISVTNAIAAARTFATKVQQFKKQYPAEAETFQRQLEQMQGAVQRKTESLQKAQGVLDDMQKALERMQAIWDMSQALQAANATVGLDTGDIYEKMKTDTAVDAVYHSVDQAFAELDVATALEVTSAPSLSYQPAQVIDITPDVAAVPVWRKSA